ncbi:MAG: hypothetical protein AAGJ35_12465, partial [Myxococcota bacterium]
DKRRVLKHIAQWKVMPTESDLSATLLRAQNILQSVQGVQAQIIVLSDFTRPKSVDVKAKIDKSIALRYIPIRPQKPATHQSILNVEIAPAPYIGPYAYQFTATIRNFSGRSKSALPVTLYLDNTPKNKGFLNLPAWGIAQKSFIVQLPKSGIYQGFIEVEDPLLTNDNRRFFSLRTQKQPRILLVNGDPRPISYLDEIFYIKNALRDEQVPFQLEIVEPQTQMPSLADVDVLLLCNVERLPRTWERAVQARVQAGMGLFLSMGENVRPRYYNRVFAQVLPRALRSIALAAQRPDGTGVALQRSFGPAQSRHPIFRTMYEDGIVFQSAQGSRLMQVEPSEQQNRSQVLWRFSHGLPLLLERKVDKGKVLLLTTSIDRNWTDLPIRPFFQPWIQNVVRYLAGGARFQQHPSFALAKTYILPASTSTL